MAGLPAREVEGLLRTYADRGVFRSFHVSQTRGGKLGCRFEWLTGRPLTVVYDPQTDALEFPNLLPEIPAASAMYAELKAFVRERADPGLPGHRRIDPERAKVKCSNRKGNVSIIISLREGDREYGVTRAVKLVNEIFLNFLRGPYFDYMVANFGEPAE
jgi:hypothetical protein